MKKAMIRTARIAAVMASAARMRLRGAGAVRGAAVDTP
jgi:hypothetical protein